MKSIPSLSAAMHLPRRIASRVVRAVIPRWPRVCQHETPIGRLMFTCRSEMEVMRATSVSTKEPGTYEWIISNVKEGDVFFDIGANIGVYSLLAAHAVGNSGKVVAFEPHLINASSLLANVSANGLTSRVMVVACALSDRNGFFDFDYSSLDPGASLNQLRTSSGQPGAIGCAARELKPTTSIDELVETGVVPPPSHIKIDVDGIELLILSGMQRLLRSSSKPRTIQVEVDASNAAVIDDLLVKSGYKCVLRHDTALGLDAIRNGRSADEIARNVLYAPQQS